MGNRVCFQKNPFIEGDLRPVSLRDAGYNGNLEMLKMEIRTHITDHYWNHRVIFGSFCVINVVLFFLVACFGYPLRLLLYSVLPCVSVIFSSSRRGDIYYDFFCFMTWLFLMVPYFVLLLVDFSEREIVASWIYFGLYTVILVTFVLSLVGNLHNYAAKMEEFHQRNSKFFTDCEESER